MFLAAPARTPCKTDEAQYCPSSPSGQSARLIALVIGFGSSSNLAAAYGIAVTGTMLITNILAIAVAVRLWNWSPLRTVLGALPFIAIDLGFFLANSVKIPAGGWFPLVSAGFRAGHFDAADDLETRPRTLA